MPSPIQFESHRRPGELLRDPESGTNRNGPKTQPAPAAPRKQTNPRPGFGRELSTPAGMKAFGAFTEGCRRPTEVDEDFQPARLAQSFLSAIRLRFDRRVDHASVGYLSRVAPGTPPGLGEAAPRPRFPDPGGSVFAQ
jgi:hypothetical protein